MKRVPVRALVGAVMAAGLLVSLSACANGPLDGGCTPVYASGSNSELVTAKGKIGDDPKAEFATPLIAKKTQVTTITKGDGAVVPSGATAVMQVSVYNAATGETLITSDYTRGGVIGYVKEATPAFGAVIQCDTIGSRAVAVGPVTELLGEDAISQYSLPIGSDDTIVLVVDVTGSYLGKANGADQPAQAGFPSVVLAPDGRPGFSFASGQDAPTKYGAADLKVGKGATVKKGDAVVLNYTGVVWGADSVAETTWDGLPTVKVMASLTDDESGVTDGLLKAIVGKKVGSQVVVIVPPDLGYASGSAPAGVPEGSTLVYVVDILGIYK
jgi:peptidylprolyl isomerase